MCMWVGWGWGGMVGGGYGGDSHLGPVSVCGWVGVGVEWWVVVMVETVTWALSQYKDRLSQVWGFPCSKIRGSRDHLIFNMGIPILVSSSHCPPTNWHVSHMPVGGWAVRWWMMMCHWMYQMPVLYIYIYVQYACMFYYSLKDCSNSVHKQWSYSILVQIHPCILIAKCWQWS